MNAALGLSVHEIALEAGVAPSTVRFYERRGVIRADRTSGGARVFGFDVPCRIAIARAAQRVGLDLIAITTLLEALPDDATDEDWDRLTQQLVGEARRRIAHLEETVRDLTGRGALCALPLDPADVAVRRRGAQAPVAAVKPSRR